MGKLHTVILVDDRDWGYVGTNKAEVASAITALHTQLDCDPGCITHKPCDVMGLLLFDIHRESPSAFVAAIRAAGIPFDSASFYGDDTERSAVQAVA